MLGDLPGFGPPKSGSSGSAGLSSGLVSLGGGGSKVDSTDRGDSFDDDFMALLEGGGGGGKKSSKKVRR